MTRDELVELATERDRWWPRHLSWPVPTLDAVFDRLSHIDASTAYTALFEWVQNGSEHPPEPAQWAKRVLELHHNAVRDREQSEPPIVLPDLAPLLERWYPGEQVSWQEHIRRWHSRRPQDCQHARRFCDIHTDEDVEA